jgi:hypothetical protein
MHIALIALRRAALQKKLDYGLIVTKITQLEY